MTTRKLKKEHRRTKRKVHGGFWFFSSDPKTETTTTEQPVITQTQPASEKTSFWESVFGKKVQTEEPKVDGVLPQNQTGGKKSRRHNKTQRRRHR